MLNGNEIGRLNFDSENIRRSAVVKKIRQSGDVAISGHLKVDLRAFARCVKQDYPWVFDRLRTA